MVFLNESARGSGSAKPQRIAKQTTISAKPSAPVGFMAPQTTIRKAPARRSAPRQAAPQPSVSPVRSTSTGQVRTNTQAQAPRQQAMQNRVAQNNNKQGKAQPKPSNKPAPKSNSKPAAAPKATQGKVATVGTPAPSIDDYLSSDTSYQGGVSELMKTLEQFKSGNQASQQDVQSAFKTAMERMGQEREQSLKSLQEDFASRGLLNSGLYAQANSDYDTQYNQRVGDLTKDQQSQLGNLGTDESNFEGLNQTQQAALRAEAIRRRADQYNVTA